MIKIITKFTSEVFAVPILKYVWRMWSFVSWFVFPHDSYLLSLFSSICNLKSWKNKGKFSNSLDKKKKYGISSQCIKSMDPHFLWIHTKDWWSWHLRRCSLWLKMWLKFSHSGSFYWIPFCVDSLHVSLFFSGDNNKCLTMSILTRLVGVILSKKSTSLPYLDDCGQWMKTHWREHKCAYSCVTVVFCWERSEVSKYLWNTNKK